MNSLLAGSVDAFWPHAVLLSLSVFAGIAVGAGILLERPKYSAAVPRVATWLVIAGVAIESVCTICLFVVDEGISLRQQNEIISLREFAKKAGSPRFPDFNKLSTGLAAKPTATVEILYDRGSIDAYPLAAELWRELKSLNWGVEPASGPVALREPPPESPRAQLPLPLTVYAWPWGSTVLANRDFNPKDVNDPLRNLVKALGEAYNDLHSGNTDKSLPDGVFRIVIGPRPFMQPADTPP
jgi:hypothetical protein